jgi:tRNA(fMet)-specific endonuclease VapC
LSKSYVLDTNVLLALIRGNNLGAAIDKAYGLRTSLQRHIVSIASQAEIWVLADKSGWREAKRDALRIMFEQLVVIPVDGQGLVDAYVQISAFDRSWPEGARNMGKNDLWIASTALHAGLALLTTDKDFIFLNNNPIQVLWIDPNQGPSDPAQ